MVELTVGADPEAFLFNSNGDFVSAHDKLPGTKQEPCVIDSDGNSIQVDGVATEFNTAPAKSADQFEFYVRYVSEHVRHHVYPLVPNPKRDSLYIRSTVRKSIPKSALVIGCDPDESVYMGPSRGALQSPSDFNRYTGGHIHVGWVSEANKSDVDHKEACRQMAATLDILLGFPLKSVDSRIQNWGRRPPIYREYGRFRAKSYGVEYRTPSSSWQASPAACRFIFNQCKLALDLLSNGEMINLGYTSPGCKIGYSKEASHLQYDSAHKWKVLLNYAPEAREAVNEIIDELRGK